MISTGEPFQDVCTKPPKWFRRVKELFRADVARRHIRRRRGAFLNGLAHFPRELFTLWRQRGRRRPPRQLQPGPAQRCRTLQSRPAGNAALPELAAALLRHRRLSARLRQARLRWASRICRRSGLERRLIGRAGLLGLTRPRCQSRLWRTRLLLSLPILQSGQRWLAGLTWQLPWSRLAWLTRLLRRTRSRLQTLPVRRARLLLSWAILQSRLLLLSGPVLTGQAILPRPSGLTRLAGPDRPVRIHKARVGAAEGALFVEHAPAKDLRRVHLAHKALIARHHLWRNRQGHRGEACACAIVDLDAADPAVGIRIKLDRDVVRSCGGSTRRHLDEARRAADAEGCGRRGDFHVTGLCNRSRHKGHGALGDVEHAGILLAAVLIHERVDGDLCVGLEIERGAVAEGDAERRACRRLHHVV